LAQVRAFGERAIARVDSITARLSGMAGAMLQGLFDWVVEFLGSLGLLQKNAKIIFLGLDNSGKSTLLHVLKDNSLVALQPTLYPHSQELVIGRVRFKTWDLGGHETARRLWREYCATVDGIVFLVDAADRTRFAEVQEELGRLLADPGLSHVPVVVLGNKIDIPVAASECELREQIGLRSHVTAGKQATKETCRVRPLELFMVSVVKRMGYAEAFQWLSEFL